MFVCIFNSIVTPNFCHFIHFLYFHSIVFASGYIDSIVLSIVSKAPVEDDKHKKNYLKKSCWAGIHIHKHELYDRYSGWSTTYHSSISISLRRYASCVGPKECMHVQEMVASEKRNNMNIG